MIRSLFRLGALGALVSVPVAALAETPFPGFATNPQIAELYDSQIVFDVLRNGTDVGDHTVDFTQDAGQMRVTTNFEIAIPFLFFTAYRFTYASTGTWDGSKMLSLSANVDQNGETHAFDLAYNDGMYRITSETQDYETQGPLFPTNHWNSSVLPSTRVLNTLTGNLNEVDIIVVGRETVETENGPVEATRHAYTGMLETEVWYDDDGRWVKMMFKGSDGSDIEYVCRKCQGGPLRADIAGS